MDAYQVIGSNGLYFFGSGQFIDIHLNLPVGNKSALTYFKGIFIIDYID